MVLRTKGVRGSAPIAPNSKTCTSWGAWSRWARIAATWGMPKPMKAVFWFSSRRAHWAIMNSASVNSRGGLIVCFRRSSVSLAHGGPAAEPVQALEPHPLFQHLRVRGHRVDVPVEVLLEPALTLELVVLAPVLVVHLVEAGHAPRIGAERRVDHRVHHVVGDRGLGGILPDIVVVDDLVGRDDHATGGHGRLEGRDTGPEAASITVDIGLMDVDEAHVGVERGDQRHGLAAEGIRHHLGAGVRERVGAQERPGWKEGHPHGPREMAEGQGAVGPLAHTDAACLHGPVQGIAEAHEAHIDSRHRARRRQQSRLHQSELGAVPEVPAALPDDLPDQAERTSREGGEVEGDVGAVLDESGDSVCLRAGLVDEVPALVIAHPRADHIGIREAKFACAAGEDIHTHPGPLWLGGTAAPGQRSGQSLAKPPGTVKHFTRQDKGLRTFPPPASEGGLRPPSGPRPRTQCQPQDGHTGWPRASEASNPETAPAGPLEAERPWSRYF